MEKTSTKFFSLQKLIIFAPLYLCLLIHQITILIAGDSPPRYVPVDSIALDCGSASDTLAIDNRNWTADTNSKHSIVEQEKVSIISKALEQPAKVDPVPYGTARISRSQFTYIFHVTKGPKFIRLYFYPSSYSDFTSSSAFFSVKSGPYTLLSNFSAALNARALGLEGFFREFCLNVGDDQNLNITFAPSPGMAGAFAFINGIEIVSMPTNLYYSAEDDTGVKFVNQMEQTSRIETSSALGLMYRVNMGGNSLPPQQDNGMFRSWINDHDYLTDAPLGAIISNDSIQLSYNKIQNFSAPDAVYQTAMSMGNDPTVNENYNLTWQFGVDSEFTYLVRLHFCEFQPPIQETGDRVFEIYIATQTAERLADVIAWSGGNGIPVYRDYAVMIGRKESQKVQNLSIALHPVEERHTVYSDAILNGLEIFKLSSSDNLAGPNLDPSPTSNPTGAPITPKSTKPKNNLTMIVAIVGGSISGFVALSILIFLIYRRRLQVKDSISSGGHSFRPPLSISSTKSTKNSGSSLPFDLCHHFSLAELKAATNNFDEVFIIGVGGFGSVYKGFINGGAITVAIKRLNPESKQGANEFKTEIEMLSQLRHLHLVSLIGYCNENHEMILVYDYMARGTLRDHLYNTDNPPLTWNQRLQICVGAARGLFYLHSGAKHTIIHRDVKTTNILLDEKWVAKVSDFGLSKIGPTNMSKTHVSTVVKGSFGYLDPEYYRLQQLTEKSDVYSFGVVLCEVLFARPAVGRSATGKPVSLAELARQCYRNGTLNVLIDPYLAGKIAPDCLNKFAEVAVRCLQDNGAERPSMSDVVWGLEFALQLQESAGEIPKLGLDMGMESPLKGSSIDNSSYLFSDLSGLDINSRITGITVTSSSDDQSLLGSSAEKLMNSGAVFSEIMNPKGR